MRDRAEKFVLVGDHINGVRIEPEHLAVDQYAPVDGETFPGAEVENLVLRVARSPSGVQPIFEQAGERLVVGDSVAHDHARSDHRDPANARRLLLRPPGAVPHPEPVDRDRAAGQFAPPVGYQFLFQQVVGGPGHVGVVGLPPGRPAFEFLAATPPARTGASAISS